MYLTAEVRWFEKGSIPPAMMNWFTQIHPRVWTAAEQTNYYYSLPNDDAIGIKLRQNRIEIKKRQAVEKSVRFTPLVTGAIETWEKWSVALCPVEINFDEIDTDAIWVGVHKRRNLQRYRLTELLAPIPVAYRRRVPQGFSLELSQITVRHKDWWTIAFEFYGIEKIKRNEIKDIIGKIFTSVPDLRLTSNSSYGYPQFLNRHIINL